MVGVAPRSTVLSADFPLLPITPVYRRTHRFHLADGGDALLGNPVPRHADIGTTEIHIHMAREELRKKLPRKVR